MIEAQITRSEAVVVEIVDYNDYGDMLFADKGGNNYKIKKNRVQYFKNVIIPETAVQLNYAVAYGKEYIYNAKQVEGELPPPTKPVTSPQAPPTETQITPSYPLKGAERPKYGRDEGKVDERTAVMQICELYRDGKLNKDDPLVLGSLVWLNKVMGQFAEYSWQAEAIELIRKLTDTERRKLFSSIKERKGRNENI